MKVLDYRHASVAAGLLALMVGTAATVSFAAGDTPGIQTGFSTPVMANEEPAPPGTGPNQGDTARAMMQDDPQAFAMLGMQHPPAPGAGRVAGVDANDVQLHGRAGWNPALVQLQAKPIPFPWKQAAAGSKGVSTKTASAAPAAQPR
jgi:hypothetical protein